MYLSQVREEVDVERRETLKAREVTRKIKRFLRKEEHATLSPSIVTPLAQIRECAFLNEQNGTVPSGLLDE